MLRKRLYLAIAAALCTACAGNAYAEETTFRCSRLRAIGLEVESVSVRVHAHDVQEAVALCEVEFSDYSNPNGYDISTEAGLLRRYATRPVYWKSFGLTVADVK